MKNPRTYPSESTSSVPITLDQSSDANKVQFDKNLKPSRKALPSAEIALKIANAFVSANKNRIDRDAYIVKQRGNAAPFDIEKLRNSGNAWMSNLSAGFLAAFVARVAPSFLRAVNSTKYLTSALLDDTDKSLYFQEKFTKLIRSWSGWQSLLADIIDEDTLLGRAVVRCSDPYTYKAKFYTTSNALLPENAPQNIDEIPLIVFLDDFLIHEFIGMIDNKEKAEVNGWNIDNCVTALNKASSINDRSQDRQRAYEDWIQQGAYAETYDAEQPKTVKVYTILAQEPDTGKISEMTITRDKGLLLYKKDNKYDKMSDCAVLFCYTRENGTAHGSKGLGRLILNHHEAFNRSFNKLLDDTYLAGMRVVELPERQKVNLALKVQAPFLITSPGIKSQPSNMNINVDAFYAVVRQITAMAEQTAGAYVPATLLPTGKSDKTATEATIEAAEQAEIKEGVIGRFLSQFNLLTWMLQRRVLNTDTYLEEVKEFQKDLREYGFTDEDFKTIREANPFDHIVDYSSSARNAKIARFYATQGKGNPAYDQQKLAKVMAEVIVDVDFAKDVVVVSQDPTVDADAKRMQDLETATMLTGTGIYIPVSPVDNDIVHLIAIQEAIMSTMTSNPILTKEKLMGMQMIIQHAGEHIEQAKLKKVNAGEIRPFEQFIKTVVKQLENYVRDLERIGQQVATGLPNLQQQEVNQPITGEPTTADGGNERATATGEIGRFPASLPASPVSSTI